MTDIIINTKTGEKGDYADWVRAFDEIWAGGAQNLDRFMTLLSRDVLLIAPGLQPTKKVKTPAIRCSSSPSRSSLI
jgi:hypothetical protein